jgi:hypothetical protein
MNKKEYLIELFIKKTNLNNVISSSIEQFFNMAMTDIPGEKVVELKEKFSSEEYIKKISPIIDSFFSEDELSNIVGFYSSKYGRKIFDTNFLKEVDKSNRSFFGELEKEVLILKNKK